MSIATSDLSVCERVAKRVKQSIGSRRYQMWFDRSARFDYDDASQCLQVAVPNRFVADWIGRHFETDLRRALTDEVGRDIDLNLNVAPERFATGSTSQPTATTTTMQQPTPYATQPRYRPTQVLRHQLKHFIAGPSNELAFAAANRLVDGEHAGCSPLFVYGGCGLGKTHLLQGICRKMIDERPAARVLYTTAEQFTNEFLHAVRNNKIDPFRRKIRRLDLLAIDDLHFICNKPATQREFLHSFDSLELGGAQVVMASDNHPKLIQSFSEALVSRCIRGMVVQIRQPDTATRLKIVRALAIRRGIPLNEAVVNTIATRCLDSVREIEGTLTKLHALAGLVGSADGQSPGAIGHTLVHLLFDDPTLRTIARKPVRFDDILKVVAQQLAVDRQAILGSSRHKTTVLARGLTVHLARRLTTMSYPEIAAAMGRRGHSTVITAAQRIEKQLAGAATVVTPANMEYIPLTDLVAQLRDAIHEL